MSDSTTTVNAQYGDNRILMFRLYDERATAGAVKLALQTQHDWKYDAKSDSTSTKDGTVNSPATASVTLDIEAVSSLDDVNKMLDDAALNSKKLEVWDVNLADKDSSSDKYAAKYAQGYLQSWEIPAEAGKLVTVKTTMNIDQKPQDGQVTLSDDQLAEIQYAFADTDKVSDTTGTGTAS